VTTHGADLVSTDGTEQSSRPSRFSDVAAKEVREPTGANNIGTEEDARMTGIGGDLVTDAIDRAFAAQGRAVDRKVQDLDAVRA
jgi:hypothetical protein